MTAPVCHLPGGRLPGCHVHLPGPWEAGGRGLCGKKLVPPCREGLGDAECSDVGAVDCGACLEMAPGQLALRWPTPSAPIGGPHPLSIAATEHPVKRLQIQCVGVDSTEDGHG